MPHATKIATCSYCGARAALVLKGQVRHELACASCGAPLHDMKMLRADAVDPDAAIHRPARPRREVHATPLPAWEKERRKDPRKVKKKKRKSLAKRFFEEAFDAIEDIFD
ncbi:hypothetical protein [Aestuariicoccus sp. MJ-SS9]|uniref:hypothetical protein n=1 Tax=Aestuariicoccus sp. MJ-SS9 TaxID=3079855 RepID=UPI002906B0B6|nr:hypothetical protein [Aestuariicoccus sp. MJ-SS9]MDU8912869.1 hypothetical protein [Aestuariicoccus sp. MJ-SS9]